MMFHTGPGRISCARSGRVLSVVHEEKPDLSYLAGACVGELSIGGRVVAAGAAEVLADVDEVEFVHTYPDLLRVMVRHTFAAGWGIRIVFSNLAAEPQVIDRAEFLLAPEESCVAWALAGGVTTSYVLAPADGTGALLGGHLRLGTVKAVTTTGLDLGRIELAPRARYVVAMEWDWYRTPKAVGLQRFAETPRSQFWTRGESVQILLDDDVAVVAPDALVVNEVEGHLDLVSEQTGTFPVELRSARGTTTLQLAWVDPVEEMLARLVGDSLGTHRSTAGVATLAGVAEALVVQQVLALGLVDDPDDAADALDLFTARLRDQASIAALEAAFLCREFDRTGDRDLLTQASRAIMAEHSAAAGTGIAATQLCLGLIVSGQPVEAVLQHLAELVDDTAPGGNRQPSGTVDLPAELAALELLAVTHAGPGASGVAAGSVLLIPRIAALGLHLGAGLKGRAVRPLPVAQISQLITVFGLLPDPVSAQLDSIWGCSAHALARASTPELLARLAGEPVGDAHAWLVLDLQTS
jgi:hypothetical protein